MFEFYEHAVVISLILTVVLGLAVVYLFLDRGEAIIAVWKEICAERKLTLDEEAWYESAPFVKGFIDELYILVTYILATKYEGGKLVFEVKLPASFPEYLVLKRHDDAGPLSLSRGNPEFQDQIKVEGGDLGGLIGNSFDSEIQTRILKMMKKYRGKLVLAQRVLAVEFDVLLSEKEQLDSVLDDMIELGTALLATFRVVDEIYKKRVEENRKAAEAELAAEMEYSNIAW